MPKLASPEADIARAAGVDRRTLARYRAGQSVSDESRRRIEGAIQPASPGAGQEGAEIGTPAAPNPGLSRDDPGLRLALMNRARTMVGLPPKASLDAPSERGRMPTAAEVSFWGAEAERLAASAGLSLADLDRAPPATAPGSALPPPRPLEGPRPVQQAAPAPQSVAPAPAVPQPTRAAPPSRASVEGARLPQIAAWVATTLPGWTAEVAGASMVLRAPDGEVATGSTWEEAALAAEGMRAAEGSSPEAAPEEETPPPAVVRFSKAHGGVERVSVLDGTTGQPPPEREPAPMQPPRNLSQNLSEQRSRPNEAAQQPEPYALEMGTWRLNQRPGDPPVATQRDPGPSTAFDQLQRGAAEAARCLGHRLGAWYIRADASVAAATSCETCAAGLHVALMPEGGRPNIEGRAATTLCSGGAA